MYHEHIIVTADNAKENASLLNRLHRVIGYLGALSDQSGNKEVLNKIKQLHDNKGMLIVTWNSAATSEEKKFLSKAWESGIGDGADNVEHELS